MCIKRILLAIATIYSIGNASTYDALKENFIKQIGSDRQRELSTILVTDHNFNKAMDFLTKHENMLKMPELKTHGEAIRDRYMPDCEKAMPYLAESFKAKKNTLSAYLGLHCINNDAFMKKDMETTKLKRLFAEGLYEKEKELCMSYIEYGDMLNKGIGGSPDYVKALKIFEDGKKKCFAKASDWEKRVIDTKIEQAKLKARLYPVK